MDVPKILGGALAVNRTLFGINYLLRPEQAGPTWIGRVAKRPGTKVMTRSQGVRDVALGGGALCALTRGNRKEARVWLANTALVDAADLAATLAVRDKLPRHAAALAMGVAGLSAAVAALAAAGVKDDLAN